MVESKYVEKDIHIHLMDNNIVNRKEIEDYLKNYLNRIHMDCLIILVDDFVGKDKVIVLIFLFHLLLILILDNVYGYDMDLCIQYIVLEHLLDINHQY